VVGRVGGEGGGVKVGGEGCGVRCGGGGGWVGWGSRGRGGMEHLMFAEFVTHESGKHSVQFLVRTWRRIQLKLLYYVFRTNT
jgi:hypothetical protein